MIARDKGDEGPRPEELAAYADGELAPAASAEVEAWLAEHPDAAAEVEAVRGLSRLWQAAPPPEPSAAQWADVLGRIEARLPAPETLRPRRRRRLAGVVTGLAAAAAAAAILFAVRLPRPTEEVVLPPPPVEPLPVVTADDVEIISISAADARALVVGEPPVREELALLAPGEVTVDQVKSEVHGMNPYFQGDGSTAPMILMTPQPEDP
jgi:anti-sigma factor RsiW